MTGRSDAPRTDPHLRHLSLVVRTAWEHLGGDPAVFALQVSRRLPGPVTARAGRMLAAAASSRSTKRSSASSPSMN